MDGSLAPKDRYSLFQVLRRRTEMVSRGARTLRPKADAVNVGYGGLADAVKTPGSLR